MSRKYQSGEEPHVGDRVLGIMSDKHAVVTDLLNDTGTTRNIVVTYDDSSVPERQDANSRMYALVERAKPEELLRQWHEGEHVEAFGRAYRVVGYDGESDRYELATLGADGEPDGTKSSSGTNFFAAADVMRDAQAIARYHEGDTVSVPGRRGFAKVIGFGEVTKRSGVRARIQWDGAGVTEFVPERELRLVAKGVPTSMLMGERKKIGELENAMRGVTYRLDEAEERLDCNVEKIERISKFSGDTAARLEDTDRTLQRTVERVGKIEAREGSGSAGLNALSSTVGNVERELVRLHDKVNGAASSSALHVLRGTVAETRDELRTDLALLAKAQLRSMGIALHGELDPVESLRYAVQNGVWLPYGRSTEISTAQGQLGTLTRYDSVQAAESSAGITRGVTPASVGDMAKALTRLRDVEQAILDLKNRVGSHEAEIFDGDGEHYFGGLVERVEELAKAIYDRAPSTRSTGDLELALSLLGSGCEKRFVRIEEALKSKASADSLASAWREIGNLGAVLHRPEPSNLLPFGESSLLYKRLSAVEHELAKSNELVSQLREKSGFIVDVHPVLGKRIVELERRFNRAQARAKSLRNGPQSYDKRIASLEQATASLIRNVRPPSDAPVWQANGGNRVIGRLDELEAVNRNRENYLADARRRGADYETRLGKLEAALDDPSGTPTERRAWDSAKANIRDHEHRIASLERDLARVVGIVTKEQAPKLDALAAENKDLRERMLRLESMVEGLVNVATSQSGELDELRQALDGRRSENTRVLEEQERKIADVDELARDAYQAAAAVRERLGRYIEQNGGDAITRMVDEMNRQVWSDDFDPDKVKTLLDDAVDSERGVVDGGPLDFDGEPVYAEETDDGTVVVDVIFCVQPPKTEYSVAWECLHKNDHAVPSECDGSCEEAERAMFDRLYGKEEGV